MKPFFADSYAILAVMRGDAEYSRRFREASFFRTGNWNLLECYYAHVSQGIAPQAAADRLAPFLRAAVGDGWDVLRAAAEVRIRFRSLGRVISNVDAVGYALARRHGLQFLTGDPSFKGMPGVDFLIRKTRSSKKGS